MSAALRLSLVALDVLWEDLGLGATPAPLLVPSHGSTSEERGRLRRAVWQDLADRGLARRGRLEPDLEDALTVLVRYSSAVSVFGVVDEGRALRARVAGTQRYAVLVTQEEDGVLLAPAEETRLAWSIVDVLPAARRFPGHPVTVPDVPPDEGGYLTPAILPASPVAAAERMLTAPRLRAGFFTAYGRNRRGRVTASPELAWTDTALGRFSSRSRVTRSGRGLTEHAPATSADLARAVRELLAYVHADD